jgi:hypothetical protein
MPLPLEQRREEVTQPAWACPSCGSDATARYCGNCGERRLGRAASVAHHDAGTEPKHSFLDRLTASLRTLASPPGRLTADWIRGRRVGYLPPLSLFLWINVTFFLVQSASGLGILSWPLRAHLSDESIAWVTTRLLAQHRPDVTGATGAYADVFDALEAVHAKSLVIVMVPAFAAVLAVLLLDRRPRFVDSLTFATHFFAFALIWLCALFPTLAIVLRLLAGSGKTAPLPHSIDLAVSALEAAVLAWYIYVALGTVFGLSRVRRLATALALVAALYVILKAYHVVVFATTLYSI